MSVVKLQIRIHSMEKVWWRLFDEDVGKFNFIMNYMEVKMMVSLEPIYIVIKYMQLVLLTLGKTSNSVSKQ
jgi:hypothetical protein